MRHARAVLHVKIANPRWRGKRSRHSRRMHNPQFYVSGKRPTQWFLTIQYTKSHCICCSSCQLDMFMFPYDTQICDLDFGNVMEIDTVENVSAGLHDVLRLEFYSPSNEFDLQSTHVKTIAWQVGGMRCKRVYFLLHEEKRCKGVVICPLNKVH